MAKKHSIKELLYALDEMTLCDWNMETFKQIVQNAYLLGVIAGIELTEVVKKTNEKNK